VARARNIKPGLYQNDVLAECSVWARYIFPGLWMLADRDGKLEDRPAKLKAALLPYDSQNIDKLLVELHNRGFIYRYGAGGQKYIQILNFRKHQNPHFKEPASTIPDPDGTTPDDGRAPDSPGARTGPEQNGHSSGPADSGFLIPDPPSRIPDPLKPESGVGTLPFPSERFADAWARWGQHRRETHKPLTPTSTRQQLKKLAELGEDRAVRAIDHSIANGYQGIFEPTTRGNHAPRPTSPLRYDASIHPPVTPLTDAERAEYARQSGAGAGGPGDEP
jgi:hypothetical protein